MLGCRGVIIGRVGETILEEYRFKPKPFGVDAQRSPAFTVVHSNHPLSVPRQGKAQ